MVESEAVCVVFFLGRVQTDAEQMSTGSNMGLGTYPERVVPEPSPDAPVEPSPEVPAEPEVAPLPSSYARFNVYFIDMLRAVKSAPSCKRAVKAGYRAFDHASRAHLDGLAQDAAAFLAAFQSDGAAALEDPALQATPFARGITLADLRAASDQLSSHALLQSCFVFAILVRQALARLPDEAVSAEWDCMRRAGGGDPDALAGIPDEDVRALAARMILLPAEPAPDRLPPGIAETLHRLESTKLGKLAKSITDELKLGEGASADAFSDPALLGNILGKVGSVMQKSMADGDLNLNDMLSEVTSMASAIPAMLSGLTGSGGAAGSPAMADLLKSLAGAFTPPVQHGGGGGHRGQSARARLANRLAKRGGTQNT